MLFQPQLCRQILNGRKTETRRLVKPGKAGAAPNAFYRAGSSYPLERPMRLDEANELQAAVILRRRAGRPPRKEVGRIRITAVTSEPLGNIDFGGAKAEGFKTPAAFKAYWMRLHDAKWVRRAEHRPESGIGPALEALTDDQLAESERFTNRWATKHVWVIRFEVEPTTLFLAEQPGGAGSDYVTSERDQKGRQIAMTTQVAIATAVSEHVPSASEPSESVGLDRAKNLQRSTVGAVPEEAVHPEIIDGWTSDRNSTHQRIKAQIRDEGHITGAQHREIDRRMLELEDGIKDRVHKAKKYARGNGINVSDQLKALRHAQDHNRAHDQIEGLVQNLERDAQRAAKKEDIRDAA